MTESSSQNPHTRRRLNHIEMMHRPGEQAMAIEFFTTLGCRCSYLGGEPFGQYLVAQVEGSETDVGTNVFFLSEAQPEQLAIEAELQGQIDDETSELGRAFRDFHAMIARTPYRAGHFGIRLSSVAAVDAVLARIEEMGRGEWAGRVAVRAVLRPTPQMEERGNFLQAFIWTDVVSAGLLSMGQMVEIQGIPQTVLERRAAHPGALPEGISMQPV